MPSLPKTVIIFFSSRSSPKRVCTCALSFGLQLLCPFTYRETVDEISLLPLPPGLEKGFVYFRTSVFTSDDVIAIEYHYRSNMKLFTDLRIQLVSTGPLL